MKQLFTFIIILASLGAGAQYQWDWGVAIGGANYLGDIGGKEQTRRDFVVDMHLNQTNIAVGLYGRYKFSKRLSLAGNFTYLQINTSDSESTNPARVARNLNFRNRMLELGLRGELTLFYDNDVGGRGYYNPTFKFYVFGGISAFRHNPQGQIRYQDPNDPIPYSKDKWWDLRDFRTEDTGNGEYESYGYYGVALPAGLGLHFTFNKEWRIGWELSWRTTFTDYLDDISAVYGDPALMSEPARAFYSQSYPELIESINDPSSGTVFDHQWVGPEVRTKRGDPTNNDSYLTTQLTIGKVIRGRSNFYRSKYSWLKNRSRARRSRAKF